MSRDTTDRRTLRTVTAGIVITLGFLAAGMVVDSWWHWLLFAAAVATTFVFLFVISWPEREQP